MAEKESVFRKHMSDLKTKKQSNMLNVNKNSAAQLNVMEEGKKRRKSDRPDID